MMKRKLNIKPEYGVTLLETLDSLIRQKIESGKSRTSENYRSTANKSQVYVCETSGIPLLRDSTDAWVSGFVRWLKENFYPQRSPVTPASVIEKSTSQIH